MTATAVYGEKVALAAGPVEPAIPTPEEWWRSLDYDFGEDLVPHPVCEWNELTDDDDALVERIVKRHPSWFEDEIKNGIRSGREYADDARALVECLLDALGAYRESDLPSVIGELEKASRIEWKHGDDPTVRELAHALLRPV